MKVSRVIPCLDVDAGRVVKGVNFVGLRDAGDPVELAARYDEEGADELVFLDITASSDDRDTMVEVAAAVAARVFIPFTIGGGVRSVEDARALLRAGADKVSINSAAVQRPELISELAAEFGSQCVVVAIDSKAAAPEAGNSEAGNPEAGNPDAGSSGPGPAEVPASRFEVYVHGGRTPTGLDTVEWARRVVELGAGEILLTSMNRDGTKVGFDLPVTSAVSSAVTVPVIASGGVGTLEHLVQGITLGGADAVLAASIFHFGDYTVAQAKAAMAAAGVNVRPADIGRGISHLGADLAKPR